MTLLSWDRDIFFGNPADDEWDDEPEILDDGSDELDWSHLMTYDDWQIDDDPDYPDHDPIEPPDYSLYLY